MNHTKLTSLCLLCVFAGLTFSTDASAQANDSNSIAHRCSGPVDDCPLCSHSACDGGGNSRDVEYGRARPVIDAVGWVAGIPGKLLLWDRRVDNHRVSEQSVNQVTDYLRYRGLSDVKVRVNQYDPVGEWRRLVKNDRMSPFWKYTAGDHSTFEVFTSARSDFGGDSYNPYTDTVSIYSDLPSLGMAESAYAYDIRKRQFPGTYAVAQSLPLISMWHETLATNEVLTYISFKATREQESAMRKELYARYGVHLGGEIAGIAPDGGSLFQVVGAVAGHATAMTQDRFARQTSQQATGRQL